MSGSRSLGEASPGEGSVGCLLRPDTGSAASQRVSSGPNLSIPLSVNNSSGPDQLGDPRAKGRVQFKGLGSPLAPLLLEQ